jgi:hypothetical protein
MWFLDILVKVKSRIFPPIASRSPRLGRTTALVFSYIGPLRHAWLTISASISFRLGEYAKAKSQYRKLIEKGQLKYLFSSSDYRDQLFVLFKDPEDLRLITQSVEELSLASVTKEKELRGIAEGLIVFGLELECRQYLTRLGDESRFFESTQQQGKILNVTPIEESPHLLSCQKLVEARPFKFELPNVFEESSGPEIRELVVPESKLWCLKNAQIIGGFEVVCSDTLVIHDPSANPLVANVSGSWKYISGSKTGSQKVLAIYNFNRVKNIEEAVLVSGRVSTNYFHFLIEYLPRACSFLGSPEMSELPILIDQNMPAQQFEALDIIFGPSRKKILFSHESTLAVEKLWIPSLVTFQPDRFDIPFWKGAVFSHTHLTWLRESILNALEKSLEDLAAPSPRRVFLSRSSHQVRGAGNRREAEDLFREHGFEVVYPEKLSFLQQVRLFTKAEIIAGSGGAAFSNLIFCGKGTKVLCLVSERVKDYAVFSNLAQFAGCEFMHLASKPYLRNEFFPSEASLVHASYVIDLDKLKRALKSLVN